MKITIPAVFGVFVGILITAPASGGRYVIEVYNDSLGKMIIQRPAVPGNRFSLEYMHSIQLHPVVENFTFDKQGDIILTDQIIMDHGHGLPEPSPKDHWRLVDDKIHIYNINKRIGTIVLRVSFLHDQFLVFGSFRLNLVKVARGGQRIIISVHRFEE
ncbi:MAG: DUF1850 domain-containing protein [Deltaproteobacteria bacterium]|nr:DUF1850 domain-containing protein [Deltaproteobacteria bacterium]MBW2305650.1 DUF1850 domain-containing protein [Deltaproteobacteria bacterium]